MCLIALPAARAMCYDVSTQQGQEQRSVDEANGFVYECSGACPQTLQGPFDGLGLSQWSDNCTQCLLDSSSETNDRKIAVCTGSTCCIRSNSEGFSTRGFPGVNPTGVDICASYALGQPCVDATNIAECQQIKSQGCTELQVLESCPLQFRCASNPVFDGEPQGFDRYGQSGPQVMYGYSRVGTVAIIGIIIAATIGAALLVALAVCLVCWRRKQAASQALSLDKQVQA